MCSSDLTGDGRVAGFFFISMNTPGLALIPTHAKPLSLLDDVTLGKAWRLFSQIQSCNNAGLAGTHAVQPVIVIIFGLCFHLDRSSSSSIERNTQSCQHGAKVASCSSRINADFTIR